MIPAEGPAHSAPLVPPRRSKLPWIIGGAVLGVLVLVGVVVAIFVGGLLSATRGPQEVVGAYDRAFDEVDCALYLSITTPAYQESYLPNCEQFEATAQDFVDNYSEYKVAVTGTSVEGETATVETTESYALDGEQRADEYSYGLVLSDGAWLIDSVALR